MVERIRNLISRFPENEASVRDLVRKDPEFDALCKEYQDTASEIDRLSQSKDSAKTAYAEALKLRQRSVEEDILTRIEGYRPV
ncbi:MAG TPA: hypothetical protein VLG66_13095 [Alphaproteobacteria bacterium]|jgi:uncharacterized protein YdcH (DUF465 family)|nr:hypothetical protein [Alphaproteobacteria bacterium]